MYNHPPHYAVALDRDEFRGQIATQSSQKSSPVCVHTYGSKKPALWDKM